ncbi:MAG: copper amine oxidase N-terminal domain-containing protein [Turicibacter sp.]|nr:copper amine oxidase N-terminal domain-containing protein [Turicibacter sp.]
MFKRSMVILLALVFYAIPVAALERGVSFGSFEGEITEITPVYGTDGEPVYGEYFVTIEGEGTVTFHVNYYTFVLGEELSVGDTIVGFYDDNLPMIMIYPPRHRATLIVNGEFYNVALARFQLTDGNLVSTDGLLQLNFTDDSEIILQDGQNFRDAIAGLEDNLLTALEGRLLVVTYGPATMAIPAMTIPGEDGSNVSIVVLFEPIATGPAELAGIYEMDEPVLPTLPTESFVPLTGTVIDIDSSFEIVRIITVETDGGSIAHFHTNDFTYILGDEISIGDVITGFYDGNALMIMIYPPQYSIRLIVNGEFENVMLSRFNLEAGVLVSENGFLQLNFTDDTEILLQDGQDFRETIAGLYDDLLDSLDGRLLAVVYGPATMSIPAVTIPGEDGSNLRIIVLFDSLPVEPTEPNVQIPEIEEELPIVVWTVNEIVVNGQITDIHWIDRDDTFFLPLRRVLNYFDFDLAWDAETSTIRITQGTTEVTITPGSNVYRVNDLYTTSQWPAPVIIDGVTYVPFRFFAEILGLNNAYLFEGQIVIDDGELMQ